MRVIITGGTGLIGRALSEDLIRHGHEVIILSRHPGRAREIAEKASVKEWDIYTDTSWYSLVDGAHAMVNLAGENIAAHRWTEEHKHRISESRVNVGRAVVRAIEAVTNPPHVFIQASGIGYYGACGDEEITEDTPQGSDFLAGVAIKWEASTESMENMGVRRAVIRTGAVLSRDGGALPRMMLPFKFFVGGPLGKGKQWFPWIHIFDEVSAIRFLIENETTHGPYNLVAPGVITSSAFSKVLGRTMGRPSILPVPEFVLRVIFGEMVSVLITSQRAVPERLLKAGFAFRFEDAESALGDLLK